MREKIPVLKCSNCDEEVDLCDACGKGFAVGQKIICLYNGELHFCSEKCLDEYLKKESHLAVASLSEDEKTCSNCKEEVDKCDWCYKKFRPHQKIICLEEESHFCSEECLRSFINEETTEAKTFLDNTDY